MRAKKSLGQNFLKSKQALRDIVAAARVAAGESVLEVGPGKGALTAELLESGAKVIAVEKDDRLIEHLKEKFAANIKSGGLEVVHGDILHFDPASVGLAPHQYKLVANIPYYITGELLRKFLESSCQPALAVLMLQKEVAKRIVSADGKESILSMSVKAYGTPSYIVTVKAKYFSPAPKVDSAIILIDNISKNFFADILEKDFFTLVKKGFGQKRKMLFGNLGIPQEARASLASKLDVSEKVRAENLTLEHWKKLISMSRQEE